MRLLFGMILGVLLTVGVAYVVDSIAESPSRQMVNWEVAKERLQSVTSSARDASESIEKGVNELR
jgi:hypothetical protein